MSILAAGARLGPYVILAPIGAGGMGEVYRARDSRLEREVAIKLVRSEMAGDAAAQARLRREARAVAALSHPNVVAVYDVGEEAGCLYLVMELLDGETLRERLARGALPVATVLDIGTQIAGALTAAHGKEIVHRDLKPENVMLDSGRVKVLDFGLARRWAAVSATASGSEQVTMTVATEQGTLLGTPGYLAPEQIRGGSADARSDVFALGCVLYEALSGRRPFEGDTLADLLAAVLRDPAAELSSDEVPPRLTRAVARCLEKRPEERFQSAADLAYELREIAAAGPVARPRRGAWRRVAVPVAAAALVAAAAILAVWIGRERRPDGVRAGEEALAVLPFTSVDPAATDYLGEGLAEGLHRSLAAMPELRVVPLARRSGAGDRGRTGGFASSHGATAVLRGRLGREGDGVRIHAELVDVRSGSPLWSDDFVRTPDQLPGVEQEILVEVCRSLELPPPAIARAGLARSGSTGSALAYELYLKGRHQWSKRTPLAMSHGLAFFMQAAQADPAYALAYAGLADSYITLGSADALAPFEAFAKARAAAETAVRLDPGLPEAHSSIAAVYELHDWDWPAAEREHRRAVALGREAAGTHHWLALFLARQGRVREAAQEAERARALDPASPIILTNAALVAYLGGDQKRAVALAAEASDLEPSYYGAPLVAGVAYLAAGDSEAALERLRRAVELSGEQSMTVGALAYACAVSGPARRPEAEKLLARLVAARAAGYTSAGQIGLVHSGLGSNDAANDWFERAVAERSPLVVYFATDPRLASLRATPRFRALLRRLRLPAAEADPVSL